MDAKWLKNNAFNLVLCLIVLLGVLLRLKGFLVNSSFWHDECALGWNIKFRSLSGLFTPLRFLQVAPPLFLALAKGFVNIFDGSSKLGVCDLVLRAVPFAFSVFSIGLFYLLSRRVLESKISVSSAMVLFSFNQVLINYSFEFKPYALDVFFVLALVLIFQNLSFQKEEYRKNIIKSFIVAGSIWCSIASCFVVVGGFLTLLFKKKNIKKVVLFFFPFLLSVLLYLKYFILPVNHSNVFQLQGFWENNFVLLNLSNLFPLLIKNIAYFFHPAKCLLFILILALFGTIIFYKEKRYDFINIAIITIVFVIVASMLRLYPFSERLVLFLIPIFIILITKPLDKIRDKKKISSMIIILLFLAVLIPQFNSINMLSSKSINKGDFSRGMMEYMVLHLKPSDNIFVNNGSIADFCYYSSFFKIKNNVIYKTAGNIPDEKYLNFLNSLKDGYYWFYLPYDYSPKRIEINFVKNWIVKNARVLYVQEMTQSALFYIKVE